MAQWDRPIPICGLLDWMQMALLFGKNLMVVHKKTVRSKLFKKQMAVLLPLAIHCPMMEMLRAIMAQEMRGSSIWMEMVI